MNTHYFIGKAQNIKIDKEYKFCVAKLIWKFEMENCQVLLK